MNDFEQWLESQDEEESAMFSSQWRIGWNAAIASMQGEAELSDRFIGEVIQNVAELPDRNSPDDWPEAMLVTSEELQEILIGVHEDVPAVTYPPDASAEIARLTKELEEARTMVDGLLAHCPDAECFTCGEIICPHKEPLHFHHDGCPSCAQHDAAIRQIGGGE